MGLEVRLRDHRNPLLNYGLRRWLVRLLGWRAGFGGPRDENLCRQDEIGGWRDRFRWLRNAELEWQNENPCWQDGIGGWRGEFLTGEIVSGNGEFMAWTGEFPTGAGEISSDVREIVRTLARRRPPLAKLRRTDARTNRKWREDVREG